MTESSPTTAAPTATARITIYRTSPDDARQRQVYVSLDDQQIATLLFGETVTRTVTPGRHRVRANNTLVWKTLEFDAKAGDDLHFAIVNRAAPGLVWMVALFGSGPMFVSLEQLSAPPPDATSVAS